jgi:uridine kinase
MKPHITGIAGPSCSGKTELARRLSADLGGAAIVSLDSYYRPLAGMPLEERRQVNFDHPDALDWELLHDHLQSIARGEPFDEPVYSFAEHTRAAGMRRIEPSDFLLVEGLFVLYWDELRRMLDTGIYVHTDLEVCFRRRLVRDVAERGRTPESVREQFERTVRPGAEMFVIPTRTSADVIVSGERPLEESSTRVLQELDRARAAVR